MNKVALLTSLILLIGRPVTAGPLFESLSAEMKSLIR